MAPVIQSEYLAANEMPIHNDPSDLTCYKHVEHDKQTAVLWRTQIFKLLISGKKIESIGDTRHSKNIMAT